MRAKAFTLGFVITLFLFVGANVHSYITMHAAPGMSDGFAECGFPFNLYTYGGFVGMGYILSTGLLADVLIAVVAALVIGLSAQILVRDNRVRTGAV